MNILVKILDTGLEYYSIEPTKVILGRQYDNEADRIRISIPEQERNSLCTMIITNQLGQVIDHIPMENNEYLITSAISQNKIVKIGFSFSRKDGYVKNSAIIIGQFLEAQKPDDFVPVQPEQKKSIDYLIKYGFTDSKLVGNELQFFNADGEKVVAFDLSPFVQEQSDLAEVDETSETFVKGKQTSNLLNDGEDGSSPYATKDWVSKNAGKIDSISVNGKQQPIRDKNVNLEVLETTGGTITGDLGVQGNLNVSGTTITKDTQTLLVKDNVIVTNADKKELLDLSGVAINKNTVDSYGVVYDPASDSVKLGLGKLNSENKFTFNQGEGNPVAVRDDSALLTDKHLVQWDSEKKKFVDSGKAIEELGGQVNIDNTTITKNSQEQIQTVGVIAETNKQIISGDSLYLATTIDIVGDEE